MGVGAGARESVGAVAGAGANDSFSDRDATHGGTPSDMRDADIDAEIALELSHLMVV